MRSIRPRHDRFGSALSRGSANDSEPASSSMRSHASNAPSNRANGGSGGLKPDTGWMSQSADVSVARSGRARWFGPAGSTPWRGPLATTRPSSSCSMCIAGSSQ